MNKNLKAGLIVGGVAVALLAVALVANAAGLTSSYTGMPYRKQMYGAYGYGMQNGMMGGSYGGRMGGNYGGMMGGNYGSMMDFDNMPCQNWAGNDGQTPQQRCPYFNQAQ
jgi:hypothetical protein